MEWRTDFEAALAEAARGRALVLVHFAAPGRPLAERMARETLADQAVLRAAQGLVAVRLDPEQRPDLYARLVGGRGALASAVVDGSGDVVAALAGHAPPEVFVVFLETARAGWPRLGAARTAARRREPAALQALGETYEALGSPRRAEEVFWEIVALHERAVRPGEPLRRAAAAAHERLARAMISRGRNREARAHLDAWRALDPGDRGGRGGRARFTEALVLFVERRLAEAVEALAPLVGAPGPDAPHHLYLLGVLRHELGDDRGALEALARLGAAHPRTRWAALAREQIHHIENPDADHQH